MKAVRSDGLATLRAIAAIAVLFAHGGYFLFALLPLYDLYAFAGWFGTELFFALAGYLLITQLLRTPPRNAREATRWWAWRAWRVLPLFWGALLLHVALAAFSAPPVGGVAWPYALLAQNLAWVHPAFFGEAWNLPVLVLFFFFAPLFAWVFARRDGDGKRLARVVIVGAVVAILIRGMWVWHFDPLWDAGVRKIVVTRLDACLYGALLACLLPRLRIVQAQWRIAAAVTWALAALGFALFPRDTSDIARAGLFILAGLAGTCSVAAVLPSNRSPGGLGVKSPPRLLVALARWSYPLYLINMPVLIAMALLGLGQTADIPNALLRFTLWLTASIALAALLHHTIEVPLLRARARRLERPGDASADRSTSR